MPGYKINGSSPSKRIVRTNQIRSNGSSMGRGAVHWVQVVDEEKKKKKGRFFFSFFWFVCVLDKAHVARVQFQIL